DLFQFLIEEHKGERDENEEQQRRWSITIALELEALGPMYVRLQLEDGKISTTFWANSADTTALISQNLAELAQRYQQAGLESSELRCFHGQPPETANSTLSTIVLDVKA
ncbi:MAG: flagellar hook-length control protein FliK, partial [Pseudomonadota bacterium]|nr:flagellar hook-length control protein FliK [Pseudomonadota bacterium]